MMIASRAFTRSAVRPDMKMRPVAPIIWTSFSTVSGAARSASFAATQANKAGASSNTSKLLPGTRIEASRNRLRMIGVLVGQVLDDVVIVDAGGKLVFRLRPDAAQNRLPGSLQLILVGGVQFE